jgi:hypothetical protein
VVWIDVEDQDARIAFGNFAMQPFELGNEKTFSGPSADRVVDGDTGMYPKFPLASGCFPLCHYPKRLLPSVPEIVARAVKEVLSLVFHRSFTVSIHFSASSSCWGAKSRQHFSSIVKTRSGDNHLKSCSVGPEGCHVLVIESCPSFLVWGSQR